MSTVTHLVSSCAGAVEDIHEPALVATVAGAGVIREGGSGGSSDRFGSGGGGGDGGSGGGSGDGGSGHDRDEDGSSGRFPWVRSNYIKIGSAWSLQLPGEAPGNVL